MAKTTTMDTSITAMPLEAAGTLAETETPRKVDVDPGGTSSSSGNAVRSPAVGHSKSSGRQRAVKRHGFPLNRFLVFVFSLIFSFLGNVTTTGACTNMLPLALLLLLASKYRRQLLPSEMLLQLKCGMMRSSLVWLGLLLFPHKRTVVP